MADPQLGGDAVAQIIAASGTAVAAVIGAVVLWPTRRRRERAAMTAATDLDPEDRPARLRERITKLETRVDAHDDRLEHVEDVTTLLRAQEITAEAHARPPRRRAAQ